MILSIRPFLAMPSVTKYPKNKVVDLDGSPSVRFIIDGNAANALGLVVARYAAVQADEAIE
jgi:hypothetical protein